MMYYLRIFLSGLCMGTADLVPGISGGTVAFLLGIYEPLIDSIRTLRVRSILKRSPSSCFLGALLLGMALAMLLFSHTISYFLKEASLRSYLYSLFLGLIGASLIILLKEIKKWQWQHVLSLCVGAIIAYFLSGQQVALTHVSHAKGYISPWLIFSGAAAISAMLLPGISGSYLLMILGVYPIALEALSDFSLGLKNANLDISAIVILSNILVGIIIGALAFSHAISWMLRKAPQMTLSFLIGFIIGAIRTAWPFWKTSYIAHPFKPEKGLILLLENPILPDLSSVLFWQSLAFAFVGFAVVFLASNTKIREITS